MHEKIVIYIIHKLMFMRFTLQRLHLRWARLRITHRTQSKSTAVRKRVLKCVQKRGTAPEGGGSFLEVPGAYL